MYDLFALGFFACDCYRNGPRLPRLRGATLDLFAVRLFECVSSRRRRRL
ncbi:hypothetical protein [Actinomadura sp. HBU206391]|nr:hypothetical protein [Actinomadura sp. HBU206391]